MLHPRQFDVNQAWIAFKINDMPYHLAEGEFNSFVLMDAASCYILCFTMASATDAEPSATEVRFLFEDALEKSKVHRRKRPQKIFVAEGQFPRTLPAEAKRQRIAIVRVPEEQLLVFIDPVRESAGKYIAEMIAKRRGQ